MAGGLLCCTVLALLTRRVQKALGAYRLPPRACMWPTGLNVPAHITIAAASCNGCQAYRAKPLTPRVQHASLAAFSCPTTSLRGPHAGRRPRLDAARDGRRPVGRARSRCNLLQVWIIRSCAKTTMIAITLAGPTPSYLYLLIASASSRPCVRAAQHIVPYDFKLPGRGSGRRGWAGYTLRGGNLARFLPSRCWDALFSPLRDCLASLNGLPALCLVYKGLDRARTVRF